MIKELLIKYQEIIKYIIFGVLTTLVNIAVYFLFNDLFKINYLVSTIIAWVVSVLFAYITNRIFVFASKNDSIIIECIKFFSVRLFSLLIDVALMYLLVSILTINDGISKIVANVVIIAINYILSKILVFRNKDKVESE